jgi:hypothetical protein
MTGQPALTTSTQVKLSLSPQDATSGVAQMRFFDRVYGDWEDYATSRLSTFKTGEALNRLRPIHGQRWLSFCRLPGHNLLWK